MRRSSWRWVLAIAGLVAGTGSACTADFGKFEVASEATGGAATGGVPTAGGQIAPSGGAATGGSVSAGRAGGSAQLTGGAPGSGGTGGASDAGRGGQQAPSTGGSACGVAQKKCGELCVPNDDPLTGCATGDCDPCVVASGTASCAAGVCAIARCEDGHNDCDGAVANGCEVAWGSFTDEHCGGCGSSCSSQGLSGGLVCQNALCRCTSAGQCGDRGTFDCAAGICSCEGAACQIGETCSFRDGPSRLCGCNGVAACAFGTTCCPEPSGCRDLQNDSGNCGACGWICPAGTTCIAGTCG